MKETAIYIDLEQTEILTYNGRIDIPSMETMRYDTEPYRTVNRKPVVTLKKGVFFKDGYDYHAFSKLEERGFVQVDRTDNIERQGVNVYFEKRVVLSEDAQQLLEDLVEDKRAEIQYEFDRMRSLFEKEEKAKKELDKRIEGYNNLSFWQKLKRGFKV